MQVYEGKYEAYKLEELSEDVKERIVEGFLNEVVQRGDLFWSETPIDEIIDAGKALGIDIAQDRHGGNIYFDMDRHNIGFGGHYEYNPKWRAAVKALKWGQIIEGELREIGTALFLAGEDSEASLVLDPGGDHMSIECHEGNKDRLEDALWQFVHWAFSRLDANWRWEMSEQRALLELDDYEFDKDGGIVAVDGKCVVSPRKWAR